MINVSGNKWIPSEGYAYLTNGVMWTECLFLGKNDNINNWHDTNEEPPNPEDEQDASSEDYEEALNQLGVS